MYLYEQEQRFLLKGIAATSRRIHEIEDQAVYCMKDQHQKIVLKRVIKALLHDAAQEAMKLEGYQRHVWSSSVREATTVRTTVDEIAFGVVHLGDKHNATPESVEKILTSGFKGLNSGCTH